MRVPVSSAKGAKDDGHGRGPRRAKDDPHEEDKQRLSVRRALYDDQGQIDWGVSTDRQQFQKVRIGGGRSR